MYKIKPSTNDTESLSYFKNLKSKLSISEKVLGFNPASTEENIFKVFMTPNMARYILDKHNNANRKLVPSQKNAIANSIQESGWLHTGDTCAFDVTGNLTEFQHRLENIAEGNEPRTVWVATGVQKDTFQKAAPAKNRTKYDVVYRGDKTATKEEVTTLEAVMDFQKGKEATSSGVPKLTMKNALQMYNKWKDNIIEGMDITSKFFEDEKVLKFKSWTRVFNAVSTLMVYKNQEKVMKDFLDLFKKHLTIKDDECRLFSEMDKYFRGDDVGYLTGTKKTEQIYHMLCYAIDRFIKHPKGDCEFGLMYGNSNHSSMKNNCKTYRSFLVNPQGIQIQKGKSII